MLIKIKQKKMGVLELKIQLYVYPPHHSQDTAVRLSLTPLTKVTSNKTVQFLHLFMEKKSKNILKR